MRPFVDTNVLVYTVDSDEPVKRQQALDLLRGLAGTIVISAQVMAEFHVTVTRKLARPVDPEVARRQLARLAQHTVVPTDADLVRSAADLSLRHRLSLWDAMILRAAAIAGCDVVHTEDLAHGATIDGVLISNPFVTPAG